MSQYLLPVDDFDVNTFEATHLLRDYLSPFYGLSIESALSRPRGGYCIRLREVGRCTLRRILELWKGMGNSVARWDVMY